MRKKRKVRNAGQAAYQRAYRMSQIACRKPARDDVARVALHWIITEALRRNKTGELAKWCDLIVTRLSKQGFDPGAARIRINHLIEQYENGWTFQRKVRLEHFEEG